MINKTRSKTEDIEFDIDNLIPGNSVDCVIFGFENQQLKILLLKWKFSNLWTLPGGFIYKTDDMDSAARRILEERTNLENIFLNQFHTFGNMNRNLLHKAFNEKKLDKNIFYSLDEETRKWISSRFITTGYFAFIDIKSSSPKPDYLSEKCEWFSIDELPNLVYDHNDIIKKALDYIRIQLNYLPVSINLLPHKFTMQQLQKLYEDILKKKLERSNFQRKMLKLGIFIRMEKEYTGSANKAPYLYCIDKPKYIELIKNGIGFTY
ncbi:MAG: NUDIX hydrolase [Bacteroidetes bacterium]|nr:MAG: NUDIX hydrolase [Bacteroidota bacterium]